MSDAAETPPPADAGPPRRPRRVRGVMESLLSIVLVLEVFVIFFLTLTVFGLGVLDPVLSFVGGGAFAGVLLVATALVRYRVGVWIGWALQLVLILTGILVPLMFLVGAGFAAMWTWCFVRATQIEKQQAAGGGSPPS